MNPDWVLSASGFQENQTNGGCLLSDMSESLLKERMQSLNQYQSVLKTYLRSGCKPCEFDQLQALLQVIGKVVQHYDNEGIFNNDY